MNYGILLLSSARHNRVSTNANVSAVPADLYVRHPVGRRRVGAGGDERRDLARGILYIIFFK